MSCSAIVKGRLGTVVPLNFKVPIVAIKNDVCLQSTSKSHSYHLNNSGHE